MNPSSHPIEPARTLDGETTRYAYALEALIRTLRLAQTQFLEVRERQEALTGLLTDVAEIIKEQPQSENLEHALQMTSWVLKSVADAQLFLDAAIATHARALPRLSVLERVAQDLSAAVREASTAPLPSE